MKNKTKTKEKKRRKREKNGRKEKASNGHLKISICLHQRITLLQQTHIHKCNSMKRTTWNRIEWVKTKSMRSTLDNKHGSKENTNCARKTSFRAKCANIVGNIRLIPMHTDILHNGYTNERMVYESVGYSEK